MHLTILPHQSPCHLQSLARETTFSRITFTPNKLLNLILRPHSGWRGKDALTYSNHSSKTGRRRVRSRVTFGRETSRTYPDVGVRVVHGVLKVQGPQLFNQAPEEIWDIAGVSAKFFNSRQDRYLHKAPKWASAAPTQPGESLTLSPYVLFVKKRHRL